MNLLTVHKDVNKVSRQSYALHGVGERMTLKKHLITSIITGLLVVSCNAGSRLSAPASDQAPTSPPEIIDTATPPAPTAFPSTMPTSTSYQNGSLGISLDYPATWHVQEEIPDQPFAVLIASFDPASPPHKLEWDSQTVSINIRLLPQENAPPDLNSLAESAKQLAAANHLEVFSEESLELAHGVQAVRLTLVSGSGGIIDQVLTILNGRPYEIIVQGNFELARAVLDTLTPSTALKPPDSDTPASGICPQFDGEIVEITINDPPPPSPRCVQITAEQRLKIINATSAPVRVELAHFNVEIPPAGDTIFDQKVGDYLAPGVHLMLNGPEVWLVGNSNYPNNTEVEYLPNSISPR